MKRNFFYNVKSVKNFFVSVSNLFENIGFYLTFILGLVFFFV
jgi:hypothetical protein